MNARRSSKGKSAGCERATIFQGQERRLAKHRGPHRVHLWCAPGAAYASADAHCGGGDKTGLLDFGNWGRIINVAEEPEVLSALKGRQKEE